MQVGVPTEIKKDEFRVGLTPASVRELVARGHRVSVQSGAGRGIGMNDADYERAGASIAPDAGAVFAGADMIIKVKEPQPEECLLLREGQVLFTYLHLAPDRRQTELLLASGATAIAYETVTDTRGGLPLLAPMSAVAGRMSIQAGAHCLECEAGGRGILLGGVPGVGAAEVVVIGGGVVGTNALRMAVGMEARVTVLDRSLPRLEYLDATFGSRIDAVFSTTDALEKAVLRADLVIGAVLVPGASAPRLIDRALLKQMKEGAVVVDVAIDQGGCFETSRPTTHSAPTYVEEGVVHYCVANMPGAVPRTSTFALNNATLPFALALADAGAREAMLADPHLRAGLNVYAGQLTVEAVARGFNLDYRPAEDALRAA